MSDNSKVFIRNAGLHAGFLIAYVTLGWLSLAMHGPGSLVPVIWAPGGFVLAVVLLGGFKFVPTHFIAVFALATFAGAPPLLALAVAGGGALEVVVGVYMMRSFGGFGGAFFSLRHVGALVVGASWFSTLISSTIGATSIALAGVIPSEQFPRIWGMLWLSKILGNLIVAPVLLAWASQVPPITYNARRLIEATTLTTALIFASIAIFIRDPNMHAPPLRSLHVLFPLFIWAALRFELRGATMASAIACVIGIVGTVQGTGPFIRSTGDVRFQSLQAFMQCLTITALVVGGAISDRARAVHATEKRAAELARKNVELATTIAERELAENALRSNQAGLRHLIRAGIIGIVRCTTDGKISEANDAFLAMVGYSRDDLQAGLLTRQKVRAPYNGQSDMLAYEQLVAEGVAQPWEGELVRKDGTRVPVVTTMAMLDPPNCIAFVLDLTERKRAESSIRKLREERKQASQLRAFLESAPDAMIVVNRLGAIVFVNAQTETMFGYSRDELIGNSAEMLMPDRLREGHAERRDRYFEATGRISRTEPAIYGRRKNGSEFPLEVCLSPMETATGRLLSCGLRDITAQTKAAENERLLLQAQAARLAAERSEALVKEQLRRLRILAEASRTFALATEESDAILNATARASAELIGELCVIQLTDPSGDQLSIAACDPGNCPSDVRTLRVGQRIPKTGVAAHVIATGAPTLIPIVDPTIESATDSALASITSKPVRSIVAVPLNVGARTIGVVAMVRVTSDCPYVDSDQLLLQDMADRAGLAIEKARLYGDLKTAVQTRDDFLAIAGHELKTPLTALQMQIESLQRLVQRDTTAYVGDRLRKVASSGRRIATLIEQLLDVSKLASGKLQLETERLNLAEVVQEVVARFSESSRQANCPIVVDGETSIEGYWDRLRLDQIFTNLLANAVKYGQSKPIRIELSVERKHASKKAVVRVIDQGIGIDSIHQDRIFQKFERAVTTREFGGFGLGLWITRQIVEASAGSIEVESIVGRGSRFTVRLPTNRPATRKDVRHALV